MKNFKLRTLLGLGLLGAITVAPLMSPAAQADPPRHAPAYGRRAKDNRDYKQDKKQQKRDRYDRDRYDRNDRDRNDRDRYDRNDRDRNDRDRNDRDRYDRDNNNNRNTTSYSGTVSNVRGNVFDLRANGRTYNVYASSLPRGLSRGDEVRVSGRSYGDNDIRNATVRITRNR